MGIIPRDNNKYAIWALLLSLLALITYFQQQLTVFYSWYCRNAKNLSVYSGGSRPSDTGGGGDLQKIFYFRHFGPHFAKKIRGRLAPQAPPLDTSMVFSDPPVFLSGLPPGTRYSENSLRLLGSSFVSARKNPALGTSTTLCI